MDNRADKTVVEDTNIIAPNVLSESTQGGIHHSIPPEWFVYKDGTTPTMEWYLEYVKSPSMSLTELISLIRSRGSLAWNKYVQMLDPIITQHLKNNNKCLLVANHTVFAAGTCRSLAAADFIIRKCRRNLGWQPDDHIEILL